MRQPFALSLLALFSLLVLPLQARAGAAGGGTLPCAATSQVRFVEDANGNGLRDPGEDTDCANPFVDTSGATPVVTNGMGGSVCVPATLAQLRGTVRLIVDDDAKDNNVGGSQNTGEVLTLLFEVQAPSGVAVIADSYTAASLGSLFLGNWDQRLDAEPRIYGVDFLGALFVTPTTQSGGQPVTEGAFDDIAARLTQLAEDEGLVPDANDVMPIVADVTRDAPRKRLVQSSPSGCADPQEGVGPGCGEFEVEEIGGLASVAMYRLTISFAEKLAGPPPTCTEGP